MDTARKFTESDPGITSTIATILTSVRRVGEHGLMMTEAMTETVVIDPLLVSLGYAVWDVQKQGIVEGIGNVPDYTILPRHPQQWFLEVKKWMRPLAAKEANQTVGYAFSQGARWAVLTNGQEWHIYDAHCQAPLAEKCLLTLPSLASSRASEFLSLLSREAMLADRLAQMQRTQRAQMALRLQLTHPDSAVLDALHRAIIPQCPSLTREELVELLDGLCMPAAVPAHAPAASFIHESSAQYHVTPPEEGYPLTDLALRHPSPSRRTPCAVHFPDGTKVAVENWRRVALRVVEWCARYYGLPALPFSGLATPTPSKYFLALEPRHPDGRDGHTWATLTIDGRTVYLDQRHSARGFCRLLRAMLFGVHLDPATVRVRLR